MTMMRHGHPGAFLFVAAIAVLSAPCAGAGLASIPDVRVAPLLDSHWSQARDSGFVNRGEFCFNLFTPNNYRAGCSAVPMAQLIRYWRWPARISAQRFVCSVDGVSTALSTTDEYYLWDEMPGVTADGTTPAQRNAIGKLMYDCAVSLHSMFAAGATGAYGSFAFIPLQNVFGYRSAVGYGCRAGDSFDFSVVQNAVFANLDAGAPVIVSLCQNDPNGLGHVVAVDGYGFMGGKPYVHLNLGYGNVSEAADAWYDFSGVVVNGALYDKIDGVIYNIFPENSGDVLSGRVLWADGTPAAAVEVRAFQSKKEVGVVKTDEAGIYAFILPGGKTYAISVGDATRSVALPASVSSDVLWDDPFAAGYRNNRFGTLGNSWGNELRITSLTPPPEPEPEPEPEFGGFDPGAAATQTGVVYDSKDAPCGTITLKIGKKSKKNVSSVSGSIVMLDGKKYSIKSYKAPVTKDTDCSFTTTVAKLGTGTITLGNKGFAVAIEQPGGTVLHAYPADITAGFPKPSSVVFHVEDALPSEIGGYKVLDECTPEGERINVNAKGKWELGKAASPKLKKIRMKDSSGKSYDVYELQGLDDPKKPNASGLKLTYTAKTGSFKGSFTLYCNTGKKLAKYKFDVNGLVLDGVGVGRAVCKKPLLSLPVKINN